MQMFAHVSCMNETSRKITQLSLGQAVTCQEEVAARWLFFATPCY